jgi:hypothetical protein
LSFCRLPCLLLSDFSSSRSLLPVRCVRGPRGVRLRGHLAHLRHRDDDRTRTHKTHTLANSDKASETTGPAETSGARRLGQSHSSTPCCLCPSACLSVRPSVRLRFLSVRFTRGACARRMPVCWQRSSRRAIQARSNTPPSTWHTKSTKALNHTCPLRLQCSPAPVFDTPHCRRLFTSSSILLFCRKERIELYKTTLRDRIAIERAEQQRGHGTVRRELERARRAAISRNSKLKSQRRGAVSDERARWGEHQLTIENLQ